MHLLIIILLVLAGLITLLLTIGLFMKKEHYVRREIIINAPRQKVFDYLKLLKNQDEFNRHAQAGADRKKEFRGTDGTVGYVYAWSGDKNAGEGEKEIKGIVEGKKIEMEIRFVKPMAATARIIMEMESLSADQTKVYWSNAGALKYPVNILIPVMEKAVAKDMDGSLLTLKSILEK
ncbi:MAG: polyketide cyclase [Bacteroidetes bacterium]|nr:polyketide cyclase [Bacteroidota bacterium]